MRRTIMIAIVCAVAVGAAVTSEAAPGASPTLTNAAQRRYGARVQLAVGQGARKDPRTVPEDTFDGNLHSRQVISGAPYTFTIELIEPLPIEKISFADSDYENEYAPKEVEISLDGGAPIKQTLELKRPAKRQAAWQDVAIGKQAKTVRITVLSNHTPSEKVNWGGLGEIAVWTSADLEAKLKVPGYDPAAPAFTHLPPAQAGQTSVTARLPQPVKRGEHPCLLLSKADVAELRAALQRSDRGTTTLAALIRVADGALAGTLDFPDPKGPPGQLNDRSDEVAKKHDRMSLNCGTLGIAYALTGDKKYALRAAEILKGYAQRYDSYPEHKGANKSDTGKVMAQRLSEAMWLIPLIESYDHIYDSGALTDTDKQQINTQLLRAAVSFVRRKEPAAEVAARDKANKDWRTAPQGKAASNWLLFYNAATIMTGAVTGDQNLIDLGAADLRELILHGIGSDGMWGEGAIGYQFFAISALVPGLETAARQGIDLWSFADCRAKMLYDSPLRYAYPDGSAPGLHDSGRARFGDWSTMSYDYAWLRYGDPAYAFLVNASPRQLHFSQAVYFPTRVYEPLPEPKATRFGSTVFGNLGYAILRNDSVYALMDYGPHGGVHGHLDKLNLVLFAQGDGGRGDEIGGEPLMHRYEDPLHDEWTKQTIAHNSLAIDESSQVATDGKLLIFEDTPELKIMRAESAGAYAGAVVDRTVVVTADAVLDIYHGRSATSHTWDRTFRYHGSLAAFPKDSATAQPLGGRDGYQHIKVLSRQPAAQMWQGAWQTKVGEFLVSLTGAPGQEIILGAGPDHEQMALARQKGARADYAAVYQMKAWPNSIQTLRRMAEGESGVRAFELTQKDGAITQIFLADQAGAWQSGNWRSDARALCIRRQGDRRVALLCGGTIAENEKEKIQLRLPSAGNALAKGEANQQMTTVMNWSPAETGGGAEQKPKTARARK
ncbi:MAG: alginate lyase family protein [Candidatus Sumerlaeota bacterium]|nr:alginate lyase family protein [Candidatus Sumerlaeota bacterium]